LYSGETVSKADLSMRAVGTLDEAMSVLGIARSLCEDAEIKTILLGLQQTTFVVGAEMATHPDHYGRLKKTIDDEVMKALDTLRDELEASISMPTDFVVPGGNIVAAHLDHARSVCRRCEREAVLLLENGFLQNPKVIQWINRVSDLLWLLARKVEGDAVTARVK
jgi:cob(I)alamin adenosyltransferase